MAPGHGAPPDGLLAAAVDWSERTAKVFGEGSKQRSAFFSPGVTEAMRRSWAEERPGRTPYVFERETGATEASLTPSGPLGMCRRVGKRAGAQVNPRMFRHTFAIAYLRSGGTCSASRNGSAMRPCAMSEHDAKHLTDDLGHEHEQHSPGEWFLGGSRR